MEIHRPLISRHSGRTQ